MEPRIIFKLKRRLIKSFRQGPTLERGGRRIVLIILNRYSIIPLSLTIKHVELNKDLLVTVAWKEIPERLHFLYNHGKRARRSHTHVIQCYFLRTCAMHISLAIHVRIAAHASLRARPAPTALLRGGAGT